jgi:hypothetical protein
LNFELNRPGPAAELPRSPTEAEVWMHDSSTCPVCRGLPIGGSMSDEEFFAFLAACRDEQQTWAADGSWVYHAAWRPRLLSCCVMCLGSRGTSPMLERTYWPFPIQKANLSEYDREVIAFFETAYTEGFRPYHEMSSYGAGDEASRAVFMIHRGRDRRWEPLLCEKNEGVSCERFLPREAAGHMIFIEGFSNVAEVMLDWCRGKDGLAIFSGFAVQPWGKSVVQLVRPAAIAT